MGESTNKKRVIFNLAIAKYRPGQIVNYDDMSDGDKFWVDHGDIFGNTRICEFLPDTITTKNAQEKIDKAFDDDDNDDDNKIEKSEKQPESRKTSSEEKQAEIDKLFGDGDVSEKPIVTKLPFKKRGRPKGPGGGKNKTKKK